jgi:hypothetical protein
MNLVRARSIAFAGAVAVGALSETLASGSAQAGAPSSCEPAAGAYAFACTQDLGYATLSLTVGDTTVNIDTGGFQGWISTSNLVSRIPGDLNYMVGNLYGASFNDYFGFNLSSLGSTAKVTSATLTVYSGLINEKLNYTLRGVATEWISPLENGLPNSKLFGALKTGRVYDDPILSPNTANPNPMEQISFTLNPYAIADINAAIGSPTRIFAIGGHADLASSVPEPSTWIMMLAGFLGLGVVGRRRAARRRATISAG